MRYDFMRRHMLRGRGFARSPFLLALLILAAGAIFYDPADDSSAPSPAIYGSTEVLLANYERWQSDLKSRGNVGKLLLALAPIRGLSNKLLPARGSLSLDLFDGGLHVEVHGLPGGENYDVWLVDKLPARGRSIKPRRGDAMLRVGRLESDGVRFKLDTRLDGNLASDFRIDMVVVASAGHSPEDHALLFGSPSVFQKHYYSAPRDQLVRLGVEDQDAKPDFTKISFMPFQALIPQPAYAAQSGQAALAKLVRFGEILFFKETFKGNGRTCGTCHPAENNFTLDPKFIATLPPNDPLFVAEFIDALDSSKNGGLNFEIPSLMRKHALILENADGFEDLTSKFVMRGVPHTLAMSISLDPAPPAVDGTTIPPVQRTGWSGDGSPVDGSLRFFALGAVVQHFPLTLGRQDQVDFVLPSDAQLDALEAFQLSLGRKQELALPLGFKPHLDDVIAGQQIFLNDGTNTAVGAGKCNLCHENAGANINGLNFNFNTGVEAFLQGTIGPDPLRPIDGGFGQQLNADGSFGNGTFNSPVLVEAADTPPFFHNNIARTIEDATEFYNSNEFNASPAGTFLGGIDIFDFEVRQVAAFLRVLNSLENIRTVIITSRRAIRHPLQAKRLLGIAIADCQDAFEVLRRRDAGLKPIDRLAVSYLLDARDLLVKARLAFTDSRRDALIKFAIRRLAAARNRLVS